jgi:ribosomal protein L3 glutamine methyltransferase
MNLQEQIALGSRMLEEAKVSFGHGTTNAFDESVWLCLWCLGLPLHTPLDGPDSEANRLLARADISRIATLLEARIRTRKPAAYLTQEAWLQGFAFYVDERVIVPRSLIAELLVEGGLDYWLHENTQRVLDLCTGNGSLAIIAAEVFPDVTVDAADISADALEVARINVDKYALASRVNLRASDGWAQIPGVYDLILCNPPYVNAKSMSELPAEYRAEPSIALDGNHEGGEDGMDFIRNFLAGAAERLNPRGVLILEIGNERENFEAAFPMLEVIWLETSAGEDQVLLVTRDALQH